MLLFFVLKTYHFEVFGSVEDGCSYGLGRHVEEEGKEDVLHYTTTFGMFDMMKPKKKKPHHKRVRS